jgi:PadR family transcriptional regulator, regulatory protein PadR
MPAHLGEFEQLLLFALLRRGDGASGADVMDEIEERAGREVSAGAVYTGFERLERKGFVASRLGEPTGVRGGKARKLYSLEPAGAEALRRSYRAIDRMAEGMIAKLEALRG